MNKHEKINYVEFPAKDLEGTKEFFSKVQNEGGKILKPIFAFPGGSRFHFGDPNGNEFAVWSETAS